jgi:hypothetical protein
MVFTGKRKRRFTRRIKSSADQKDSETRREYIAAQERGESVPDSAYQPATHHAASKPPPRTKQDLQDALELTNSALELTNSALNKAKADAAEKDKSASKATKRAEDWKSVAAKERSQKKAAIKSQVMAEKELISAQQDLAEERYNKSVAIADAATAVKESLNAHIFFHITVSLTCLSLLSTIPAI